MPLTAEQMRQAIAARGALENTDLQSVFDAIVEDNAKEAIYGDSTQSREDARVMVLAITKLRVAMKDFADAPEIAKANDEIARSLE